MNAYTADGETPVHETDLPDYFLDATSVTNARFATFVKNTGYITDAEELGVSAVFRLAFRGNSAAVLHQVAQAP